MDAPLARLGGRRIGPHLPHPNGLLKAAERAAEIGATAVQIFADNPTSWRRRLAPPDDLDAFTARLAELDIGPLAIHAPYLINLAGADPALWERSITTLSSELDVGAQYRAGFVNVHIGSHRGQGRQAGIERLALGLREVLARHARTSTSPLLVLENSAGGGDGLGSRPEDLAEILEAAAQAGIPPDYVGFCLDTAHLWGAGIGIDDPDVLDGFLDRFDALLGPDRLAMLHLNDSRAALGSRLDRHEHIGAGRITPRGLGHLLRHPRLSRIPAYLETPGMDRGYDAINLDRVRRLIQGDEDLPTLPPDAFLSRSGRIAAAT